MCILGYIEETSRDYQLFVLLVFYPVRDHGITLIVLRYRPFLLRFLSFYNKKVLLLQGCIERDVKGAQGFDIHENDRRQSRCRVFLGMLHLNYKLPCWDLVLVCSLFVTWESLGLLVLSKVLIQERFFLQV